jgi:hypothetical protein
MKFELKLKSGFELETIARIKDTISDELESQFSMKSIKTSIFR